MTTTPTQNRKPSKDIAQEITDYMISMLEAGDVPWQQGWRSSGLQFPTSIATDKPYAVANALRLWCESTSHNWTSAYWGTYNQIKELGGQVTKSEKASHVLGYFDAKRTDDDEVNRRETQRTVVKIPRLYAVFNADQTTGLPDRYYAPALELVEHGRSEDADRVLLDYTNQTGGPVLEQRGERAVYNPLTDTITLPTLGLAISMEEYYSTAFHEATHSSGHPDRLNRLPIGAGHGFGSGPYSEEELVAELGAAMSCALLGLDQTKTLPNSSAYINNWIKKLRSEPKVILSASREAQKALELIGVFAARERILRREHELDRTPDQAIEQVTLVEPAMQATVARAVGTLERMESEVAELKRSAYNRQCASTDLELARMQTQRDLAVNSIRRAHVMPGSAEEVVLLDEQETLNRDRLICIGKVTDPARQIDLEANSAERARTDSISLGMKLVELDEYRNAVLDSVLEHPCEWHQSIGLSSDDRTGEISCSREVHDNLVLLAEYQYTYSIETDVDPRTIIPNSPQQEQDLLALTRSIGLDVPLAHQVQLHR